MIWAVECVGTMMLIDSVYSKALLLVYLYIKQEGGFE